MVTTIEIGTILGIVVILRIFTILWDGYFHKDFNDLKGQGCLMNFYHPREGDLPRDGDHPKNGDHPTLVDLILLSTIKLPNLSLLPCPEVD